MLDVDGIGHPIITKKESSTQPATPIDNIFTKGFSKIQCGVSLENKKYDHLILWAEVEEDK